MNFLRPDFNQIEVWPYETTKAYPMKRIREDFFKGEIDFDFAIKLIDAKRSLVSFLVFERKDENDSIVYPISKSSFRGNDVYKARVYNRHKELLRFCEWNDKSYILKNENMGFVSNIFKDTLTVDINRFPNRDEFNSKLCQKEYDKFVKRIRNHYPNVVVARANEVSTKKARGYIHINVIIYFPEPIPVYLHKSKKTKRKTWRIRDYSLWKKIKGFWEGGFSDIRAIKDTHDLAEYSLKYYIKDFTNTRAKHNQELTMSVLSLFNKRGFSFPNASETRGTKSFTETIIDYTTELSSEPLLFPRLDTIKHNSLKCKFLGFFYDEENEFGSETWYRILDKPPDNVNTNKSEYVYYPSEKQWVLEKI